MTSNALSPLVTRSPRIRWQQLALPLLLCFALGLYLWRFDSFQVGTQMDDAEYIVLARSLAYGPAYGLVNDPNFVIPTRYPFGWPLILAPFYYWFGGSFQALKLVALIFTLANTWLIARGWRYLGLSGGHLMGIAVASLYALAPMTVYHARMVMSEPAFLFFVLITLTLTAKAGGGTRTRLVDSAALGVAWVFVSYVRSIGVTAVLASVLYLLLVRRHKRLLGAAVTASTLTILIVAFTRVQWYDLVNVSEYGNQFVDPENLGVMSSASNLLSRTVNSLADYALIYIRDTLVPFAGGRTVQAGLARIGIPLAGPLFSLGLIVIMALGYLASIRRGRLTAVHILVAAYLCITIMWPWQGQRFLYGILPFLFGLLLVGVSVVLARCRRWRIGCVAAGRLGAPLYAPLLLLQIIASLTIDDSLNHVADFRVGTAWIKDHTPPTAVVIAERPQIVNLYAQRSTLTLPKSVEEVSAVAGPLIRSGRPVYVLIAPQVRWTEDGSLELSTNSRQVLQQLRQDTTPDDIRFEDHREQVTVFEIATPDAH